MTNTNNLKTELPDGWVFVELETISDTIYRYPTFYGMEHLDEGIPVIRGEHINPDGTISHDWSNYWYVAEEISRKFPKTVLQTNDLVMSVRGSVGKIGLIDNQLQNAQLSPNCIRIALLSDAVSPEYAFHYLRSVGGQASIQENTNATTITTIKASLLVKTPIPLPPLAEQQRIVDKIEELFSDLDHSVAALETARAQLDIYRQAVLKHAFEGKLTGNKEGWEEARIKDILDLIDGDRGRNYPKRADYSDAGHCLFLSTKNVRPNGFEFQETVFISEEKHKILRNGTLERGDIVLTTRGTIGNVALYDDSVPFEVVRINSGMLILRLKRADIFRRFLIYFIQSPLFELQIKRKRSGTAQPQLPAGVLKQFDIVIPPEKEQHAIVEEIEARLSVVDKLAETIDTARQQAEALRQSILKQAFAGKLVPQNPDDEPAEKLLGRIKNEKSGL